MRKGLTALCVILLPLGVLADDNPAVTAAKKRQDALRSVDFHFTIHETTEPGVFSSNVFRPGEKEATFPDKQFTCESTNRLLFDGDRGRFEDNHPIPNQSRRKWGNSRSLVVSDGITTKSVFGPPEGQTRDNSYGVIASSQKKSMAELPVYFPMHITCRGVRNPVGSGMFLMTHFSPTGSRQKVHGTALDEYILSGTQTTILVDPTQDYVVRRLRMVTGQTTQAPAVVVDIDYERREGGFWLPHHWTVTNYSPSGKILRVFKVAVTSANINAESAESEFAITFPPGLEVDDQIRGEDYLVRDDGSFMPRPRRGDDPTQVSADLHSNWWLRNWWLSAIAVGVLIGGAGAFAWKKSRRPKGCPPGSD